MKCIINIQENPAQEKFRTIKFSSKTFSEKILAVKGAVELMLSIGFTCINTENLPTKSLFGSSTSCIPQFDAMHFRGCPQESDILTAAFSLLRQAATEVGK
jgi:hypothetical protein